MVRASAIAIGLVLVAAPPVGVAATPPVPPAVQSRIAQRAPLLAYVPVRLALGFHYASWRRTSTTVEIRFVDKAGWEIDFVATRQVGSCRSGMERSFQLDGNKVYWSDTPAGQHAWRCLSGARGQLVRLVASSPQPATKFAAVGLGRMVASGKRIS